LASDMLALHDEITAFFYLDQESHGEGRQDRRKKSKEVQPIITMP